MKQKLKGFWREQTRHQRKRRNQSTKFWKIYRVKEVVPTMNMHWQNHLMQRIFKQSLLSQKKSGKQTVPGFHEWFLRHRKDLFEENVIQSVYVSSNVESLYYQNDIES